MLRVEGISVAFGGVRAVRGAGFEAEAGRVTGIIGPNGAGKTTMFDVVTGLQKPSAGAVWLDGHDVTRLGPRQRALLGIARTFQRVEVFGSLTARENVMVALEARRRWLGHRPCRQRADDLLARVGLSAEADTPGDVLPTSMARRLEMARALASEPKVLLLDEVSSGLDSQESTGLGQLMLDLAKDGKAVLLVEHDMDLVMRVCEQIYVLDFGEMIASGRPQDIRDNPTVRAAYLGSERPKSGQTHARDREDRVTDPPSTDRRAGATPTPPALELRDVRAGYGSVEVLRGVTLSVPASSVVALLGPNGAGKTTTLRVASRRLPVTSGCVLLDGRDVRRQNTDQVARAGVCSVREGRGVFSSLTVAENLRMWTYRGGLRPSDVEEVAFTRFPRLAERRNQVAGTLSGGEQQMLAMSRALSTNPTLLLLDEISIGLAPIIVGELYELVAHVAAEGFAILIVEQFAEMALGIAHRAAVMVKGQIELDGPPAEVGAALADVYLRTKRA